MYGRGVGFAEYARSQLIAVSTAEDYCFKALEMFPRAWGPKHPAVRVYASMRIPRNKYAVVTALLRSMNIPLTVSRTGSSGASGSVTEGMRLGDLKKDLPDDIGYGTLRMILLRIDIERTYSGQVLDLTSPNSNGSDVGIGAGGGDGMIDSAVFDWGDSEKVVSTSSSRVGDDDALVLLAPSFSSTSSFSFSSSSSTSSSSGCVEHKQPCNDLLPSAPISSQQQQQPFVADSSKTFYRAPTFMYSALSRGLTTSMAAIAKPAVAAPLVTAPPVTATPVTAPPVTAPPVTVDHAKSAGVTDKTMDGNGVIAMHGEPFLQSHPHKAEVASAFPSPCTSSSSSSSASASVSSVPASMPSLEPLSQFSVGDDDAVGDAGVLTDSAAAAAAASVPTGSHTVGLVRKSAGGSGDEQPLELGSCVRGGEVKKPRAEHSLLPAGSEDDGGVATVVPVYSAKEEGGKAMLFDPPARPQPHDSGAQVAAATAGTPVTPVRCPTPDLDSEWDPDNFE